MRPPRPRLIVMVKEPRPGRVKTRLGRGIGMVDAAWWFRHRVRRLLRELRDPRWQVILAVSPDKALHSRTWPAELARIPQGRGDLGRRMRRLLALPGRGPILLIGGDIPAIRRRHIARAFAALGRNRAVFGPACDGGFWLVGWKAPPPLPPRLFEGVRWSSPHALADSIATLPGPPPALVDRLADVDSAADLARIGA